MKRNAKEIEIEKAEEDEAYEFVSEGAFIVKEQTM